MMRQALVSLLTASGTGDAIDTYVRGNVFMGAAPDAAELYPCLVYTFAGGSAQPTLTTSGVLEQRVEVSAFAMRADPARNKQPGDIAADLRTAVIRRLNGWSQVLADGTVIIGTQLLNPGTDMVTEQRIFRCLCEFYVRYTLTTS